jgi:hypothetical protein
MANFMLQLQAEPFHAAMAKRLEENQPISHVDLFQYHKDLATFSLLNCESLDEKVRNLLLDSKRNQLRKEEFNLCVWPTTVPGFDDQKAFLAVSASHRVFAASLTMSTKSTFQALNLRAFGFSQSHCTKISSIMQSTAQKETPYHTGAWSVFQNLAKERGLNKRDVYKLVSGD